MVQQLSVAVRYDTMHASKEIRESAGPCPEKSAGPCPEKTSFLM